MKLLFPNEICQKVHAGSIAESRKRQRKKISKTDKIRMATIESAMVNAMLYFDRTFRIPSDDEFREKVNLILSGEGIATIAARDNDLLRFATKMVEEAKKSKSLYTYKAYKLCLNKLKEFSGDRLPFNSVTLDYYKRLTSWMNNKGYSRNYVGTIVKNLCVFMGEAQNVAKLHNNEDYKQFKVEAETADTIYLSMEELERIHKLEITPELVKEYYPLSKSSKFHNYEYNIGRICQSLDKARNKFLIGALCALRISDYGRLSTNNIRDGVVSILPKKGSNLRKPNPIKIPVHPMMKEILDSGFDINEPIVDQVLNRQIKVVCRMAGITEEVTYYRTVGGKLTEMVRPKYELVSSHTARRSGATNMYLSGIPHDLIRVCTGHKTTDMLLKYIKVAYKEDSVMKRIANVKDTYLFIDYGNITSYENDREVKSDSFSLALTVAKPISSTSADLAQELLLSDRLLQIITSIRNDMRNDIEDSFVQRLLFPNEITPFYARELSNS